MITKPKLYPADIEKIKELTAENEPAVVPRMLRKKIRRQRNLGHELAMWYAAHQLGLAPLEHELATHVCRYLIAGELTPDAEVRSRHLRARLHNEMSDADRTAFHNAT